MKKKETKNLFNQILSCLKDISGIKMMDFCRYLLQEQPPFFTKAFSKYCEKIWGISYTKVCQQERSNIEEQEKAHFENYISDKINHYTSSQMPEPEEREDFVNFFSEYLNKFGNLPNHKGALTEILNNINAQSCTRGENRITFTEGQEKDLIKKLLNRAYALSQTPISTIRQHFDNINLIGSPYFTGRADLVNELVQTITCTEEGKKNSVYLHGIGGIGKTEVARTVVSRIINNRTGTSSNPITDIFWINLGGNDSGTNADGDELSKEDINELKEPGSGALIVVDNIESNSTALLEFCNALPYARFILAGRPEILNLPENRFINKKIDALTPDECVELFKNWYFRGNETGGLLSEKDGEIVRNIIDLADCHTVTIELFAKLIRIQDFYESAGRSPFAIFLDTLIENGFNLKFPDGDGNMQKDQPVAAGHPAMTRENRIIEQLAKLFSTVKLTDGNRNLLIQLSTIPGMLFNFDNVKKLLSLKDKTPLELLFEEGWLQRTEGNVKYYSIHSVIASAIRHNEKGTLVDNCRSFLKNMTKLLNKNDKIPVKLMTQFSWSVADVFGNNIEDKTICEFYKKLYNMYNKNKLFNRAASIWNKLRKTKQYSI